MKNVFLLILCAFISSNLSAADFNFSSNGLDFVVNNDDPFNATIEFTPL